MVWGTADFFHHHTLQHRGHVCCVQPPPPPQPHPSLHNGSSYADAWDGLEEPATHLHCSATIPGRLKGPRSARCAWSRLAHPAFVHHHAPISHTCPCTYFLNPLCIAPASLPPGLWKTPALLPHPTPHSPLQQVDDRPNGSCVGHPRVHPLLDQLMMEEGQPQRPQAAGGLRSIVAGQVLGQEGADALLGIRITGGGAWGQHQGGAWGSKTALRATTTRRGGMDGEVLTRGHWKCV